jgi:lysozyme family protein
MANFDIAVEHLLRKEGGYAPRDNQAGSVNFGITEHFLRRINHPKKPKGLTREEAIRIYYFWFWIPSKAGSLFDQELAELYFEAVVNMGQKQAAILLQRAAGVEEDGIIGPLTLKAVNWTRADLLATRFRAVLLKFYEDLAARSPEYADDLAGWKARIGETA